MKKILTVALLTFSAGALASPTSMRDAGQGQSDDGRTYDIVQVACAGRSDDVNIISFQDDRKWCLEDESYCSIKKIRVAQRACR